MSQSNKNRLVRIIFASLYLITYWIYFNFVNLPLQLVAGFYLIPYLIAGYDVLWKAVLRIKQGRFFSEHFLMSIATLGAFALSFFPNAHAEFAEAVFVMVFYQVGELFEGIAEGSSERSIASLLALQPEVVHLQEGDKVTDITPEAVQKGQWIEIYPGEKIPVDGIVVQGNSQLDTAALTGESVPRRTEEGDQVLSGMVNLNRLLVVEVEKPLEESTLTKILDLMKHSNDRRSNQQTFIEKFAAVYTPIVVMLAILLAFVPPLFTGDFTAEFPIWLHRALSFLVVSCPCALVISVPMAFFGGLGAASKVGVLVKGAHDLEKLAQLDTIIFDKTGTLTKGNFAVSAVHGPYGKEDILHYASHAEQYSSHPIAQSLKEAYPVDDDCHVELLQETSGQGVSAAVNHQSVVVGNEKHMENQAVDWADCHRTGTLVHVGVDGEYAGHIVISDQLKPDTKRALHRLRKQSIDKMIMFTGDRETVAETVAKELQLDAFHAELSPLDKVKGLKYYMDQEEEGHTLAFVGDGINDAPVLSQADLGIAMGGLGSQAAIEAADVVLMNDQLMSLVKVIRVAKKTLGIARQNIIFAITVKVLVLILASFGIASMWLAIFADVGVTILAVLNAMRTLQVRK